MLGNWGRHEILVDTSYLSMGKSIRHDNGKIFAAAAI